MVPARRERVGQRAEERGARAQRVRRAAEGAEQKVVLDLEFGDLMRANEIHSLPTLPCPATPDPAATNAPMRPIPLFLRDDDLAGKSHGLKYPIYSHCVGPKSHGLNASSPPGHATSSAATNSCAPSPVEANSCAPSPPTSSARWPPSLVSALQLPWCQPTSAAVVARLRPLPDATTLTRSSRSPVCGQPTRRGVRDPWLEEKHGRRRASDLRSGG